jgi:hypothetical protein
MIKKCTGDDPSTSKVELLASSVTECISSGISLSGVTASTLAAGS